MFLKKCFSFLKNRLTFLVLALYNTAEITEQEALMKPIKWMELREEEFKGALEKSGGLCIIPVGCFEMHGEHLPVGTDVYEAVAVAELAASMEDAVVFPAFEFGDVSGLVEWQGGINIDPVLRLQLLENYCSEIARHGFDKILLLNYHGGNPPFLNYFANMMAHKKHDYTVLSCFPVPLFVEEVYPTLKDKGEDFYPELLPEDVAVIKQFVEDKHLDGHGGLLETCLMLAIRPDLVKMDCIGKVSGLSTGKAKPFYEAGLQSGPFWYLDFPNGGFCGTDPVGATARIGQMMLRLSAEKAVKAMRAFKENGDLLKKHLDKKNSFFKD